MNILSVSPIVFCISQLIFIHFSGIQPTKVNHSTYTINQPLKKYNTIISFKLGEELVFPDFSLRYIREKKVPTPYGGAFNYLYFEVYGHKGETIEIQWVSGGIYQDTIFTYNKLDYRLILGAYEDVNASRKSFIVLEKNQLIVKKDHPTEKK